MIVNIISLTNVIFEDEADSLTVPGAKGTLTILPHHTPLITFLKRGSLKLKIGGDEKFFEIEKGVLEVNPKEVNVLVDLLDETN